MGHVLAWWTSGRGVLSTQVLQEFYANATRVSEDLQHGRRIGGLTIANPFRTSQPQDVGAMTRFHGLMGSSTASKRGQASGPVR